MKRFLISRSDKAGSKFPVRLLIVYLLCVASLPTLVVMSDFDRLEAMEEEWNWVIGWSYLLIGPVLAALYLAMRNFRRMPILAIFTVIFALFHVVTTICDYGFIPRYVADFRFGYDESTGKVDFDAVLYIRFCLVLAVPFLGVFFFWRLWSQRSVGVPKPTY